MSFLGLLDQTVTIVTMGPAAALDDLGNEVLEEKSRTTSKANIQKLASRLDRAAPTQEIIIDRETRVDLWFMFLPPEAVITALDQVIDDTGFTYEVLGEPAKVRKPNVGVHHIEALLRTVQG